MNIKILGLVKKYGEKTVINEFTNEINENTLTLIYGKSGSGKTTLINIIGLIEKYSKGTVLYDNREIKSSRERNKLLRDRIGFIVQDFGLIESQSVYQNLLLVQKIKKDKQRKIKCHDVLSKLGLDDSLHKKVYELSGGEQQRVAIAKVILKDADVILADEPTASLDDENKELIKNILLQMKQQGKTLIIVSHEKLFFQEADKIINLDSMSNH